MSQFCGKCDLYDSLVMIREINDDSNWSKITIYQYDEDCKNKRLLDIHSIKDLVPYFPYIECCGFSSKEEYRCIIPYHSFIYEEEHRFLNYKLKEAKKEYRRLKRKNQEFIIKDVAETLTFIGKPDKCLLEICRRVKEHPYSANIKGLHLNIHNYYRNLLIDEMIKYGYTKKQAYEWCFNENKTW